MPKTKQELTSVTHDEWEES